MHNLDQTICQSGKCNVDFSSKFLSLKTVIDVINTLSINSYSAEIDFERQNLMSVDVRFRRLKSLPAPKKYNIYNLPKEKTYVVHGLYKNISAC